MVSHVLGGYTFDFASLTLDIPEEEKTVAHQKKYVGSETFQWPAEIEGVKVLYTWNVMPIAQYNSLRALYLSPNVITWDPKYLGTYQVIVTKCSGKYMDVAYDEQPYRVDVELELEIRSFTLYPPVIP